MERKWEPLTLLYQGISKPSEVVEDGRIICKEVTQACLWPDVKSHCRVLIWKTRQGKQTNKQTNTLGEGALA